MRNLGINAVMTIAVVVSLFIGIAAIIAYTATSTYRISVTLQEEALQQAATNAAGTLEQYLDNTREEAAHLADRVWIMDAGRVTVSGTVAELTADASLEDVFLRHTGGAA